MKALTVAALLATQMLASASAVEYRTFDGSYNNLSSAATSQWGAAGSELLRMAPADYRGDAAFGSAVDSRGRLSGREISNLLVSQTTTVGNIRGMTSGVWQWGQFLDHDIDFTPGGGAEVTVMMSPADPYGMTMIPFSRSDHVHDAALDRQQINHITSYIDASNVYGSDATRASALREYSGGRLKSSGGGLLLPTNDMAGLGALDNDNQGPETTLFVAGDIRANEQLGLTSMHTLFMREHNRLADTLSATHAGDATWDDERIYQTARRIVGAEIQAITYNEFLPALLGSYAPAAADYAYDAGVNATIANEFSTSFFRVGHSMLPNEIKLSSDYGASAGSISLAEAFFTPSRIINSPDMVEDVMMGLMMQQSQEIDTQMVDSVRNFLFAPTGQMGLDLAALNIQRGRDHGLPDYNTLRQAYGLSAVTSFADITSDSNLQSILAQVYGGVDNIDPWVGALSEDHLSGASLGPLMTVALIEQFSRLRDGDRFFFAGDAFLQSNEVAAMVDFSNLSMMDLLDWNMAMSGMPANFFMIPEPASLWLALAALALPARRRVF
ncbi:peroxidase [Posidoniimonas polymericola]|uniref:Peroxidase n=1 Tax=Posidoniimonas polymericola TaxID=2528002 RepID=A0A5C5YL97_9BACT|nr:peroxidase family protein [Posidoniimonas polymericola]TWT75569.1 peroxidase [Posidoniimonas polymericola]